MMFIVIIIWYTTELQLLLLKISLFFSPNISSLYIQAIKIIISLPLFPTNLAPFYKIIVKIQISFNPPWKLQCYAFISSNCFIQSMTLFNYE